MSRSLAACEGALLVVDASQGVEAQTVANTYLAIDAGLELIPCMNKVDLPGRRARARRRGDLRPDRRAAGQVRRISAKTGEGVTEVLDELIARVPPPERRPRRAAAGADLRLRVRPVPRRDRLHPRGRRHLHQGRRDPSRCRPAPRPRSMTSASSAREMTSVKQLGPGEVGYVITGLKEVTDAACRRHADASRAGRPREPLPGYREVKPMVFCGLFPIDSDDYPDLRDALEKLTLNDAALVLGAGDLATRSASASAAASSGCCTWTSCASGSSASTTST